MSAYGEASYGEAAYGEASGTPVFVAVSVAIALAVGFAPTATGDTYTYEPLPATATAAGLSAVATQQATIVPIPATARAAGLTPKVSAGQLNLSILTAIGAGSLPLLTVIIPGGTDTSNGLDGRSRDAIATGTVTRPVAPVPPGRTLGERYDKTIAYPTPVMVKGRPT